MLTNALNTKDFKEMISDKSSPLLFDSGNPFISTQTILLKEDSSFSADDKYVEKACFGPQAVESFWGNQAQYSIRKAEKFKDNPNVLNNTGVLFLNMGDYDKANEYFTRALKLDEKFYPALANMGKLYVVQKQYDKAIDIYTRINELFPDDLKALQNTAHALIRKSDIDKALDVLKKVIKKDCKNASAYNNVGVIYILKKDINKAVHYLRHALSINGNFANAYNNLGISYALTGNFEKAVRSYLAAISLNKKFTDAIKNLARVYQVIGENEKAIDVIEKNLSHNKQDSDLFSLMADSSYAMKSYRKAVTYLKKALILPPACLSNVEISRIHNNMAVAYNYLGEHQESYRHYMEAIVQHGNPVSYNNLFNSLLASRRIKEAGDIILKAKKLFPDNADLLVSEGKYLYAVKDYAGTCKTLYEVIKNKPGLPTPYILLNHILTDIDNNLEDAIAIARKGLEYNPANIALINNLAYTLLQTDKGENIQEARKLLDEVSSIEDVYLIATRGLLSLKEGNIHDAEKYYNAAAACATNDELRNLACQKKLLELGKYYLKINQKKKSDDYLRKAARIKTINTFYLDQVRNLLAQ